MFQREVKKYIEEKQLFCLHHRVLVALSGGADSVALLRVLLSLGYDCEAAHCNFHLRMTESMRDEEFVRRLCSRLNVPLHVTHFNTTDYAANHHISIEMAARELRYEWFEQLRIERGMSVIAVAHHRDDSVETFLLNLVRGTGINGLKGIAPKNGYVVRPLLERSRVDILKYLQYVQQEYVTDSTNLQDEYMRNKIRLHVLPMLCTLNPSAARSIADTAARLADVSFIYNKVVSDARNRLMKVITSAGGEIYSIDIASLMGEIAPSAILFELLHPLGFNSMQIKDVFRSLTTQSGKRFTSSTWEVLRDRTALLVRPVHSGQNERNLNSVISVISEEERLKQTLDTDNSSITEQPLIVIGEKAPRLTVKAMAMTPDFIIPRSKHTACLDADLLHLPLTLRKWQAGDKFVPFGMTGKKNVSDYLTDRKYSLFLKENQYVLCSDEEIVWLVGERTDNRFRVVDTTKRILLIDKIEKV